MAEAIRQGDIPGVQLRRRQALPIFVETAWEWVTDPVRLELWLADEVETDLGPDGFLALTRHLPDGAQLIERGGTVEIVPPSRWRLSFVLENAGWEVATKVILEVAPAPRGCEVMVFQGGFEQLSLSICLTEWEKYRHRWDEALQRLTAVVSAELSA